MSKTMREEFEAAFLERFGFGRMTASSSTEAAQFMYAAEWAWEKSRSTLVVELPEQCVYTNLASDYAKGHRHGVRSVVEAMAIAGVLTK